MKNRISASIVAVGSLLVHTGCALGVAVPPPPGTVIYVPEAPPRPAPLTREQAVAVGRSYCHDRGYKCSLKAANLAKHDSIWKIKFDARGRRASGKLHLEIDAYTGELFRADEKGKLRHHG